MEIVDLTKFFQSDIITFAEILKNQTRRFEMKNEINNEITQKIRDMFQGFGKKKQKNALKSPIALILTGARDYKGTLIFFGMDNEESAHGYGNTWVEGGRAKSYTIVNINDVVADLKK